jgi:hypothetical protein
MNVKTEQQQLQMHHDDYHDYLKMHIVGTDERMKVEQATMHELEVQHEQKQLL